MHVAKSPTPAQSDVFVYSCKTDHGEFTFYLFEFLALEGIRVAITQLPAIIYKDPTRR